MDITSELTIVIPIRIDSKERKENLDIVLYYLLNTTNVAIITLEADTEQRYYYKQENNRLTHIFVKDYNPIFHRTRYLNKLLNLAKTNIIGIWDTDVILHPNQIQLAVNAVNNGVSLCYPYDGHFLFLSPSQSEDVKKDIISFLEKKYFDTKDLFSLGRPSVGGAFIVNKERYLKRGGENENFYGWGPEDYERFKRMEILEEPISRIEGPLFHLHHQRGINSTCDGAKRNKHNLRELIKICQMTKIQLKEYIDTWICKK